METEHGAGGLRTILGQVPFPAHKERIVDRAADLGADQELLKALRSMPPVDYGNADEVMRSVPLDESEPDARTRPVNPIEEETGENRKG
jgi:hypothetical protein